MANTVSRTRNTRNSRPNDRNLRSITPKPRVFVRWLGREEFVREPLEDLEEEEKRVQEGIDEASIRSHCN